MLHHIPLGFSGKDLGELIEGNFVGVLVGVHKKPGLF